jgi:glutathione S-transferase
VPNFRRSNVRQALLRPRGLLLRLAHRAERRSAFPYETQKLDLAAGDQRKPEYLKLNPRGRVPTCVVDGNVITENVGIMTYFAGGYPKAKLWPDDTWHQALAVSTMAWLSNTVHPPTATRAAARYVDGDATRRRQGQGARVFEGYLSEIDALLSRAQVGIGNHYTVRRRLPAGVLPLGPTARRCRWRLPNYSALIDRVLARAGGEEGDGRRRDHAGLGAGPEPEPAEGPVPLVAVPVPSDA